MGYVRGAGSVVVDGKRAAQVHRIFALRENGATLRQIADQLNTDGFRTPRGGTWHPSSVKVVLDNRAAYMGGPRGKSPERWPVILEDALTAAA